MASQLLSDWKGIARLYGPVLELSAYMNGNATRTRRSRRFYIAAFSLDKQSKLSKMVTVLSYDYRKIVLSYGPEKQFTVTSCLETDFSSLIVRLGFSLVE